MQKKILIVEDESIVAADLKRRLQNLEYEVTATVTTGRDALESIAVNPPNVVLMDIMLEGDMDGIETAEKVKQKYGLPVIYLTAYSDDLTLNRAKSTEPFGYLIKPFNIRDVRITIDMTLYKARMERELKESRQWFCAILNNISDAVIAFNKDGLVSFINPAALQLTGWSEAEATHAAATDILTLIDENTGAATANPVAEVLRADCALDLNDHNILINHRGQQVPVEYSAAPIKNLDNKTTDVAVVVRDITLRKATEEMLKIKDFALSTAINAMVICNLHGLVTYVNQAFLKYWGYNSEKELLGLSMDALWQLDEKASQIVEQLSHNAGWSSEIKARHRNGELFLVQATIHTATDDHGIPVCMMMSFIKSENVA